MSLETGLWVKPFRLLSQPVADLYVYDTDPLKSLDDLESIHNCDFVFICVPTPMFQDGSQDLSYVESTFEKATSKPVYILKSTVLPGTTEELSKKYSNIKIIFSPEFLTERTAKLDMLTQSRIILGGELPLTEKAKTLFNQRFKIKNIIQTDSKTAELTKYMNNTFFATKVSIMNEFKLLCDKIGANWEDALRGFVSDGRIGDSHLNVSRSMMESSGMEERVFQKMSTHFCLFLKSMRLS